jgi:glutathione S-transferase
MPLTLHHLPYSPWSIKARCALRHHGIAVRELEYIPVLGEPALRLRLRKLSGRVTVPVLFTPDGALTDSWQIALFAERVGSGTALIPNEQRAAIAEWNEASERLLGAARSCAMLRVVHAPEAALESLPAPLAGLLGKRGAGLAVRAFNAKYSIRLEQQADYHAQVREELSRVRQALAGGRRFLLDQLSYADFAMAVGIGCLRPLPSTPMGPAMRLASTDEALAAEFPDLIAWRDALHAEHRW